MKQKLIKLGYTLSTVFLFSSLVLRFTKSNELVQLCMVIGGFLLLITSIFKMIVDAKNKN